MIRFRCPHCGANLKAPDDKAGLRVKCPDCERRTPVPGAAPPEPPKTDEPRRPPEAPPLTRLPGRTWQRVKQLLADMSPSTRFLLYAVGGLGLLCFLLLPFVGGRADDLPGSESPSMLPHALVLGGFLSLMVCLVMLHGHITSCPSCRRWWAKKEIGNELVSSDVYFPDGAANQRAEVPEERKAAFKVVTYHYKHECGHCGHHWVTAFTNSYASTVRRRKRTDFTRDSRSEKRRPSNRPL